MIDLPLMVENVTKGDIAEVINFLGQDNIPILTNGPKVREFEKAWSEWLGVKYSLFVNSGSSANELTMLALRYLYGKGEIIVPPLTWVSDINSVIFSGHDLVFCDINLHNLSFDLDKLEKLITPKTQAIFLTHVLGINGLSDRIINICKQRGIKLIEDVCESHGTTFKGQKVGSIGYASNFSFYFAHHMSTIEGGVVCTNDEKFYQVLRALRSHGMVRECTDEFFKQQIITDNPELNKDFIFIAPAHNFRSTEINAVLGLSQIKRLDSNNLKRIDNFNYFISKLNSQRYITDYELEGQCNYAFIVVLKTPDFELRNKIETTLREHKVEFRRGLSGGGNQTLQPHIRANYNIDQGEFNAVNHVHHFGWYIGNYPTLERHKIDQLLELLNNI